MEFPEYTINSQILTLQCRMTCLHQTLVGGDICCTEGELSRDGGSATVNPSRATGLKTDCSLAETVTWAVSEL